MAFKTVNGWLFTDKQNIIGATKYAPDGDGYSRLFVKDVGFGLVLELFYKLGLEFIWLKLGKVLGQGSKQ